MQLGEMPIQNMFLLCYCFSVSAVFSYRGGLLDGDGLVSVPLQV